MHRVSNTLRLWSHSGKLSLSKIKFRQRYGLTVLLAALAMVPAGCVSMKNAYVSINWESLVLIAGMLPMVTALEKTGGIELIVNGLVGS